jgi:hypothetical protein
LDYSIIQIIFTTSAHFLKTEVGRLPTSPRRASGTIPSTVYFPSPALQPQTRMAEAASPLTRGGRGFDTNPGAQNTTRGRGRGSKNKHWPPTSGSDNERWERGEYRGGRGRGRGRGNLTATFVQGNSHQAADPPTYQDLGNETEEEQEADGELSPDATQEERDEFWREVRYSTSV